ncbi:MAG: DUF58 domain-containing protein [Desulfurococcales archaeon]|nr:DUF58 domain-containing protein [Desulfurococcales archaeon]
MARIIERGLTREGHTLILVGLVLLAWGIYSSSEYLLGLGLAISMVPLAGLLIVEAGLSQVTGRTQRIVAGVPVEGRLALVEFQGDMDSITVLPLTVELRDEAPPNVEVVGSTSVKAIVLPGTRFYVNYKVVARTGLRRFGRATARITDLLGLYRVAIEFTPLGDSYLRATPRIEYADLGKEAVGDLPAIVRLTARHRGTEFYMVREYQEGDDPRLIDWKATARLSTLVVKEMRQEASSPAIILFTPSPLGDRGEPGRTPFERLARIVAGLAESLSRLNRQIGFIGLVEEPVVVPPLAGPRGFAGVVDGISNTPPESPLPGNVALILREYMEKYVRERPLIIVVSPGSYLEEVASKLSPLIKEMNLKFIGVGLEGGEVKVSWTRGA